MRVLSSIAILTTAALSAPAVAAEISCQFDQECLFGGACTATDIQASFPEQQNRINAFALVMGGSIKALGETADFDGIKGTIVAMSSASVAPYAEAYVLSFTPSGAILTITGLNMADEPSVKLLRGSCEVND